MVRYYKGKTVSSAQPEQAKIFGKRVAVTSLKEIENLEESNSSGSNFNKKAHKVASFLLGRGLPAYCFLIVLIYAIAGFVYYHQEKGLSDKPPQDHNGASGEPTKGPPPHGL